MTHTNEASSVSIARRRRVAIGSLTAVLALSLACAAQTGGPPDISGNYDVRYDGLYRLTLQIGGARYTANTSTSGVVEFRTTERGVLSLDLRSFCDRPEVQCPHETLWTRVSIHQPSIRAAQPNRYVLNVIENRVPDAMNPARPGVVGGLVGDDLEFGLVLGAGYASVSTGNVSCALATVSAASGRFTQMHDSDAGAAPSANARGIAGITNGRVGTAFLGGCAFGPVGVGALLTIETNYSAVRSGAFAPPPGSIDPVDPSRVTPGVDPNMEVADAATGDASQDSSPSDAASSSDSAPTDAGATEDASQSDG